MTRPGTGKTYASAFALESWCNPGATILVAPTCLRDICFVTDVGYWQMDMTNTEGKIFSLGGPIGLSETVELSKFVRYKLGRQDLFLFDGNPDSIEKIEVIYDQHLEDDMPDPSDPDDSDKPRRRTSDLIFCYVAFAPGGGVYCYQADEEYPMGTKVVVPVGEDHQEKEAIVKFTEFHQADQAPYPLDRIKHVIRRAERGDLECN